MWAVDTLGALAHLRENHHTAHRDVKPSNVLYVNDRFSGWAGALWARAGAPGPGLKDRSQGGGATGRGTLGQAAGGQSKPGRRKN